MSISFYLNAILIVATEMYIYFDFFMDIQKCRPINLVKKRAVLVLCMVVLCAVKIYGNLIFCIIMVTLIYCIAGYMLFEAGWKNRIYNNVLFFEFAAVIKIIILSIAAGFYEEVSVMGDGPLYNIPIAYYAMNMIVFLTLKIAKCLMGIGENIKRVLSAIYFLPLPLLTFLAYGAMFYLRNNTKDLYITDFLLSILCIGLFGSNVLYFYIIGRLNESALKIDDLEMEREKHAITRDYYERLNEKNSVRVQTIHNMNQYFETIGQLAKAGHNHQIIRVLEEIDIRLHNEQSCYYCSDIMLNAILSQKYIQSQMFDIEFNMRIEPMVDISFMREIDVVALFGNLLSNAIEATMECDRKFIDMQVYMNENGSAVVFKIENTFAKTPQKVGNRLKTTKADKFNHGIGIENVRQVIKQYNGLFEIEIGHDIFKAVGVIYCAG